MTASYTLPIETPQSGAWDGVAWAAARDLKLALRSTAELGVLLLFYIIVVTLFPLAVGAVAFRILNRKQKPGGKP